MRSRWDFVHALEHPRAAHALGELLLDGRDELQLAAAPRPARDPRLRGGARGGPPRGARPLAALLAPAGLALAGLPRARALAASQRPGAAALVVVRGPGLLLRVLVPADGPALYDLARDPEVSRFFSWRPYESPDEAATFIPSRARQRGAGERFELGIFGGEPEELLGIAGLSEFSRRDRRAVLGTWLGRPFWGSGANRESKALVLAFGFRTLGLLRVTALASPQNVRSVAALERLGFVHEGVLRGWHVHSGVPRDVAILRMMRDEWERTPLADVDVAIEGGPPPPQFVVSA